MWSRQPGWSVWLAVTLRWPWRASQEGAGRHPGWASVADWAFHARRAPEHHLGPDSGLGAVEVACSSFTARHSPRTPAGGSTSPHPRGDGKGSELSRWVLKERGKTGDLTFPDFHVLCHGGNAGHAERQPSRAGQLRPGPLAFPRVPQAFSVGRRVFLQVVLGQLVTHKEANPHPK